MATNLLKRYIWLVDTIYQAKKITFEEINNKWKQSSLSDGNSLPKKTFHNHKDVIEEIFDIIIDCDTKNGYKYYIHNSDDISDGAMRNWLISTFTVNNLISESQKLKSRIELEETPSGQRYLVPIIEAMKNNSKIEITYKSYQRDQPKTFEIKPYFVKIFKQRWYIVAYNDCIGKIMIYALDRIKELSITENKFNYPKNFKPKDYFYNCYGIINYEEIKPCIIKIKINKNQSKYLIDLPLHHSQKVITNLNDDNNIDGVIFEYYIKPTFDFKKELLSMGSDAEILEPAWFREEISKEIEKMISKYK